MDTTMVYLAMDVVAIVGWINHQCNILRIPRPLLFPGSRFGSRPQGDFHRIPQFVQSVPALLLIPRSARGSLWRDRQPNNGPISAQGADNSLLQPLC